MKNKPEQTNGVRSSVKAEPLKETFDKSFIKEAVLEELHLTKNQGFGFGTLEGAIDLTIEKRDKQFASAVEWLKDNKVMKENGEEVAIWLHNLYEKISKQVGWKTQDKCQVEFKDLPEENKSVMLRMAQAIQLKYPTQFLLRIDQAFEGIKNDK